MTNTTLNDFNRYEKGFFDLWKTQPSYSDVLNFIDKTVKEQRSLDIDEVRNRISLIRAREFEGDKVQLKEYILNYLQTLRKATRVCNFCNQEKELSTEYFSRDRTRSTGLANICKECDNRRYRESRNTESFKERCRQYYLRNKHKAKARAIFHKAVKDGQVKRQPCEVCGSTLSEGHHYLGYELDHALDVMWLCRKHHRLEELGLRNSDTKI